MDKHTLQTVKALIENADSLPQHVLTQLESMLTDELARKERRDRPPSGRQVHDALKYKPGLQPHDMVGFQCEACGLICDQSLLVPVQTSKDTPDTVHVKLFCVDCASPRNVPAYMIPIGRFVPQAQHRPVGQYATRKRGRKPKHTDDVWDTWA